MTESVIGLVEDRNTAQQVRGELAKLGCADRTIAIFGEEDADNVVQELTERGHEEDLARHYREALRHGGIVVAAEAKDVDRALEVLNRFHKSPEELIERHQQEIERNQQGRRLSPEEADRVFQEGTVEMTAVKEQPIVSKEARVTEEVTMRKQANERQETIRDTVRRSEVKVEDTKKK